MISTMATRTSASHSASSFASSSRSSFPSTSVAPLRQTSFPNGGGADAPIAGVSIINKPAPSSSGLYQGCMKARAMMRRVPGFEEGPWVTLASTSASELRAPPVTNGLNQLDPVSQMLEILRLGSPLCYLFNAILMAPNTSPPLQPLPPLPVGRTWQTLKRVNVNWSPDRDDLQSCKKGAAHFIMAANTELGWGTAEDKASGHEPMFTVTQLYDQNTNATVKVIANVLRLLNLLESLGVLTPSTSEDEGSSPLANTATLDERGNVVQEILESERKYVQDLEKLQRYQEALLQHGTLPLEQVLALFINLDSLVDFQRRFLIGVEANARLSAEEQRFGHLFSSMEQHFSCYEPFCANFASASQLAHDENAALMTLPHELDPTYGLPMLLIKPVQRICKYPLLLSQLVKATPRESPYYEELREGLASMTRVTDAVNETTRQRENELAVSELRERVEDWKGHDVNTFASLVLKDTFKVLKNDSERDYHVYLFERIILCCKEVTTKSDKKASKSNSILKKPSAAKRKNSLQLKGRIFINNVFSATQRTTGGQWLLQVTWRGDVAEEYFAIKCRTEEQLKKWQSAITKAVEESAERRRRQQAHLSGSSRNRSITSPLSQFPATPQSEMGPPSVYNQPRANSHPYSQRPSEEEEEAVYPSEYEPSTGRSTPSLNGRKPAVGHRSLPAQERSESFTSAGAGRVRTLTEEQESNQWRTPGSHGTPPIPRPEQSGMVYAMNQQVNALRSSESNRQLRHKQSHEWGSSGIAMDEGLSRNGSSNGIVVNTSSNMSRQGSQTSMVMNNGIPPLLRSRSASSPNIYQGAEGASTSSWETTPAVPAFSAYSRQQSFPVTNLPQRPSHQQSPLPPPPRGVSQQPNSSHHHGQPQQQRSGGGHRKRGSDSSTDRSSDDSNISQTRTGTAASSPGSAGMNGTLPRPPPPPPPPHSTTLSHLTLSNQVVTSSTSSRPNVGSSIRFEVKFGGDTYVIITFATISFEELSEKVVNKLKNCGVKKEGEVKIRYEDEEGDRILISADDDVLMAIDWMKSSQSPQLTLYVD